MLYRVLKPITPKIRDFYRQITRPPIPNLLGDRDVENSWIAAALPQGPGKALNFGSGGSILSLIAARRGFDVTAIDLLPIAWYYKHPQLQFMQGDLLREDFPDDHFDLIINCSVVEHVGLVGRYADTTAAQDGDLEAMQKLARIIKPGKTMLLTIPVGQDSVFRPYHRVYGEQRLPRLLEGWTVTQQEFWAKTTGNVWGQVSEKEALLGKPSEHYYGLGLFSLIRE